MSEAKLAEMRQAVDGQGAGVLSAAERLALRQANAKALRGLDEVTIPKEDRSRDTTAGRTDATRA
jgi:hypothetical protein